MRKKSVCLIFGAPEELPNNVLPTYLNAKKDNNEVKTWLACTKKNYNPSFTEIAENVSNEIETLWLKASIPIISHYRNVLLLRNYHKKCRTLLKPYQKRKENYSYLANCSCFKSRRKGFSIFAVANVMTYLNVYAQNIAKSQLRKWRFLWIK